MRIRIIAISGGLILTLALSRAVAGPSDMDDLLRGGGTIVVDHPGTQAGGGASDTSFLNTGGNPSWQRIADDFRLDSATQIGAIKWWGFYNLDNPPAQETFRIRFYGARAGDGLPDDANVLFEQTVDTPMRTATGRTIFVGVDPDEYLYETQLASPPSFAADTTYWLEVIQIGDLNTAFRWEFSQADSNGQAFINAATVDWRSTLPANPDTAFQLIAIPEPSTFGLWTAAFVLTLRRRRCQ